MAYLVLIVFFGGIFSLCLKRPLYALYLLVFLAPWSGVDLDVGLRLTAYRICAVAFMIALLLRSASRKQVLVNTVTSNPWLFIFLSYCVLLSLLQSFFLPNSANGEIGMRSGQLRSLSQMVMFGIGFIPVLLISSVAVRKQDIVACARMYLWSVTVLATLGYIQLIIWYATGSDPFPIGFVSSMFTGGTTRSGVDWVGGTAVYRMSSFAGEPKGLATAIVVGLLLIQAGTSFHNYTRGLKRKLTVLWLFLMFALVFTWSTSGAFLWLIGTLALSIFSVGDIGKIKLRKSFLVTLLLLAIIAGGGYSVVSNQSNDGGTFTTVAKNRFIERSPVEDFDETVLRFLAENPERIFLGVGLGNVHTYASPYIPLYALRYMEGNIFVAKSGYLRLVSEVGIIGFFLFIAAYYWPISRLRRFLRHSTVSPIDKHLVDIVCIFSLVVLVMGMARTYIWPQMYVTMGVCMALLNLVYFWLGNNNGVRKVPNPRKVAVAFN